MTARPKLSTIGWSFQPNCTEWLHLLNEVNILDILSILIDCWVDHCFIPGNFSDLRLFHLFFMILVVVLNAV